MLLLLACIGCKNTQKTTEITEEPVSQTEKGVEEDNTPQDKQAIQLEPREYESNVVAAIERTFCFGECPVYTVRVYEDGRVVYKGIKNVKKMGTYQSTFPPEKLDMLKAMAKEVGYFEMEPVYSADVADVPTVYTMLQSFEGERKQVTNQFMGPDKLAEFEDYFDSLLNQLEWKKME